MRIVIVWLVLLVRVAAADPGGTVRIDVKCADYWATPESGLAVTIDGTSYPALGVNGVTTYELAVYHHFIEPYSTWTPTDIGYLAPAGHHHVSIAAPGCDALDQDVDIGPYRPVIVSGRLPVSDWALTNTPDGGGVAFGAFTRGQPAHGSTNDLFSTHYAFDATTVQGGSLAMLYEHRSYAFAVDLAFGTAPVTGTSRYQNDTPVAFTGDQYVTRFAMRIGRRVPVHNIALSAGTGIGGDMIITSAEGANSTSLALAPSGLDADWYVPLWTQLTVKPSCSWGASLYASYDVHPTANAETAPAFGASLVWQPSDSCSQPAGLRVL